MKSFIKTITNLIGEIIWFFIKLILIFAAALTIMLTTYLTKIGYKTVITQEGYISYKALYCDQNITLDTKEFKIWKEEQNILILKKEKKEICE